MAGEKQEYTVLNEQKLKKYNQRKCANLIWDTVLEKTWKIWLRIDIRWLLPRKLKQLRNDMECLEYLRKEEKKRKE